MKESNSVVIYYFQVYLAKDIHTSKEYASKWS